jgi:hypothetical protein
MSRDSVTPRKRLDWLILLCIDVTVPAVVLWKFHLGEISKANALITTAIALIGCNLVLLQAIRKRSQSGEPPIRRQLLLAAFILAAISFASIASAVSFISQKNNYLDLALSNTPLSSITPERTRLIVELLRTRAANSKENDRLLAEVRLHPIKPELYSANSFATVETMYHTVARLADVVNLDADYYAKQQAAMQHFRLQMATVDPDYLKAWDADRQAQEAAEASTEQLTHDWLSTVKALYGYASEHPKDITVKEENLQFATPAVEMTFNGLLNKSKLVQTKLFAMVQKSVEVQRQAKRDLNVP